MRKRIILCLFVCISYAAVGCGQNTAEDTEGVTENVGMVEKETDIVKEEKEDIKVPITGEEKTELDVEPEEERGEEEEESKVTDEEYERKCLEQLWQECSLPLEECPDYYYFTNEGHGPYRLWIENGAACVVKEYVMDSGLENEIWKLERIYSCGDTNAFLAYVESETEDELYILFADGSGALPVYIILADIRKDADADVTLPYGRYAYNSMLEWYSYQDWFDGEADGQHVHHETIANIHDSIYDFGISCAIDDYVDRTGGDAESQWEVCGNDVYVGRNGCIACAVCQNESRYFIVLWDVNNRMYAVVEL